MLMRHPVLRLIVDPYLLALLATVVLASVAPVREFLGLR